MPGKKNRQTRIAGLSDIPRPAGIEVFGRTLPVDQRLLESFFMFVLFGFGLYLAILYYGHQAVPNSDFTAFLQTGREILSFHLPSSYKRLPGLGILQALLSHITGGPNPAFSAGLLLNSILYAATGPLLYLAARPLIGRSAVWFGLLALINPVALRWMRHPIAETLLMFCITLTFAVLFSGSRWAYLCAAVASCVRYEGAILIPIVLLYDLSRTKDRKGRLQSAFLGGLVSVPICLWLSGMILSRGSGMPVSGLPYIRNYSSGRPMVGGRFFQYIWTHAVGPLFVVSVEKPVEFFSSAGEVIFAVLLLSAVFFALYKRDGRAICLLSFFVVGFILHATRDYTLPRYTSPLLWPALLCAWYGLYSLWNWLAGVIKPPDRAIGAGLALIGLPGVVWLIYLLGFLPRIEPVSRRSASVVWVAISAAALAAAAQMILCRRRRMVSGIVSLIVICVMMAGNQFTLVREVANGSIDKEFRQLADWYVENAQGRSLAVSLPHVVSLFVPAERSKIISLSDISGDTPLEFALDCLKKNVSYVAWDSRIGLATQNTYYRRWKMARMDFLRTPGNYGPLLFQERIQNADYSFRYINLYRVTLPQDGPAK